jgi:hypothetical protein
MEEVNNDLIMFIVIVEKIKKKRELLNMVSNGIQLCIEKMISNRSYQRLYLNYVEDGSKKVYLKVYKRYKILEILNLSEDKFIVYRDNDKDKEVVICFLPMLNKDIPTILKKLRCI